MVIIDPHDPRPFRQYVRFNDDGSVASVHEVAAGVEIEFSDAVEVTNLSPAPFTDITIDPGLVAALGVTAPVRNGHGKGIAVPVASPHDDARSAIAAALAVTHGG